MTESEFGIPRNQVEYEGEKFMKGDTKIISEKDTKTAKTALATKKRLAWTPEKYDYIVPEDVRLELLLEKVSPNSSCWMNYYLSSCIFVHLYYSRLVRLT